MENKRVALWDNVKCELIILVVLGHFIQAIMKTDTLSSLFDFIYSFHMPLFIFVAGLFHKNKNIKSKVLGFFAIGFVYKFLLFVIQDILGLEPTLHILSESGIPWYMFVMGVCIMLTYFVKDLNPKGVLVFSIIMACFTPYDKAVGDYLVFARIFAFFPFYFAATMINKDKLDEVSKKPIIRTLSVVALLGWLFICFFKVDAVTHITHLFIGRFDFNHYVREYGCVIKLLTMIITTVLGLSIISLTPRKHLLVFSNIGTKTLQIYFWHRPALFFLVYFGVMNVANKNYLYEALYFSLALFMVWFFSLKIFQFPTKNILNLCKNTKKESPTS